MKKTLLLLTALAVVSTGLWAQDTTWTNPLDMGTYLVPHSMISGVTNGTEYDAIDILLQSPSELSEFPGTFVYTAYGNYQSFDLMGGQVTPVNPFTTNALTTAEIDGDVYFQLGYIMPVMGMQAGIGGGFEIGRTDGLAGYDAIGGGVPATAENVTYEQTDVQDAVAVGTEGEAAYSSTETYEFTGRNQNNSFRIGAGIDLGALGVSLTFMSDDTTRVLGGSYNYSWALGTDTVEFDPTAANNITTAKSVKYGFNDGEAGSHAILDNDWDLEATGQLPFVLKGTSMPITAALRVGSSSDGTAAGAPINTFVPKTVSITEAYVNTNNAAGGIDDVTTLTFTEGIAEVGGANDLDFADTSVDFLGTGLQQNNIGGFAGNYAIDSENIKDSSFNFGISARIDPKLVLNDVFTARTRVGVSFDMALLKDNISGFYEYDLSRADDGAINSTETFRETIDNPFETTDIDLTFEIGGILEAKSPSGRLSLSSGIFYYPVFNFQTTENNPTVVTSTHSVVDNSVIGTAAEVDVNSVWGSLGLGAFEGSMTQVATTEYTGPDKTNVIDHNFIIPVTARIDIVKDKFSLIGGYVLTNTITSTYRERGTVLATETELTASSTSTGTSVLAAPVVDVNVDDTATSITSNEVSEALWAGQMNFMLRWQPMEEMTVDFYGQSIMSAFNFDIFGDDGTGTGFNGRDFIDNLGMSVSFHF